MGAEVPSALKSKDRQPTKLDLEAAFGLIQVVDIDNKEMRMGDLLKGHTCTIIVNMASKWSNAQKNYSELVTVYNEYSNHGIQLIGFPSNQFFQEQGSPAEIKKYAQETMNVTFPVMQKCDVNGPGTH